MRHSIPKAEARRIVTQAVHKGEGKQQNVLGQAFQSFMNVTYPDVSKLPTVVLGGLMQNVSGQTLFRLDYSATDGDHVLG